MKSIAFSFLLATGCFVPAPVRAQSSPLFLRHFMRDVLNPRIPESDIIDTYLCHYLHEVPDKAENKNYAFARGQITGIRAYTQQEKMTAAQFKIYKYADIPSQDQTLLLEETNNVYVCYYNNALFNFLLVNRHRIDSFTTLNKAGRHFFISYCQ